LLQCSEESLPTLCAVGPGKIRCLSVEQRNVVTRMAEDPIMVDD